MLSSKLYGQYSIQIEILRKCVCLINNQDYKTKKH